MLEVNLKPEDSKPEKDEFTPEPVPTYEEWLNAAAKDILKHPGFALAKGAIEFVRYLWTRERLLISLLVQKDVIQQHEVNEFFGDDAHTQMQKEGTKHLTRYMLRSASQGEITGPDGEPLNPDQMLIILNDILDLNNTGWDGRTLELLLEIVGKERNLKEEYEKTVAAIESTNKLRAKLKATREQARERKEKLRAERERRVRIYVSQCRIADKPLPTEQDQRLMIEGTLPIPRGA